jgi:hypothetical protein
LRSTTVEVGGRRIDAQLDPQRPIQRELALQLAGRKGVDDVAQQGGSHSARW